MRRVRGRFCGGSGRAEIRTIRGTDGEAERPETGAGGQEVRGRRFGRVPFPAFQTRLLEQSMMS